MATKKVMYEKLYDNDGNVIGEGILESQVEFLNEDTIDNGDPASKWLDHMHFAGYAFLRRIDGSPPHEKIYPYLDFDEGPFECAGFIAIKDDDGTWVMQTSIDFNFPRIDYSTGKIIEEIGT